MTLEEARKLVVAGRETGVTCPCCGQWVRLYRRTIHSMMARGLIELWKLQGHTRWVDVLEVNQRLRRYGTVNSTSDFSKLRYWGLVTELPGEAGQTRTSGMWRLEPVGVQFVRHLCEVPKHALVYDGKVMGYGPEQISIVQALGRRFDYQELMAGV